MQQRYFMIFLKMLWNTKNIYIYIYSKKSQYIPYKLHKSAQKYNKDKKNLLKSAQKWNKDKTNFIKVPKNATKTKIFIKVPRNTTKKIKILLKVPKNATKIKIIFLKMLWNTKIKIKIKKAAVHTLQITEHLYNTNDLKNAKMCNSYFL